MEWPIDGALCRFMSITGQPLDLGFDSSLHFPASHLSTGQCLSIDSFEKLNQLGEGSRCNQLITRSLSDRTHDL